MKDNTHNNNFQPAKSPVSVTFHVKYMSCKNLSFVFSVVEEEVTTAAFSHNSVRSKVSKEENEEETNSLTMWTSLKRNRTRKHLCSDSKHMKTTEENTNKARQNRR